MTIRTFFVLLIVFILMISVASITAADGVGGGETGGDTGGNDGGGNGVGGGETGGGTGVGGGETGGGTGVGGGETGGGTGVGGGETGGGTGVGTEPSTPSGPTSPGTGGAGDGGGGSDPVVVVTPPVVVLSAVPTLSIPDQTVNEDAGSLNNLVDLFAHAADDITAVASLIFSIVSQSASNIISCSLDSNRFIDCITQSDQNGFSDVTVSVTDGDGQTTFDTFRITVLAVDEPAAAAQDEAEPLEARERVYIGAISFDKEFVKPGDELLVYVSFQNKGNEDLKGVRLTAIIQDLGIRSPTVNAQEVDDGDRESKFLLLEIPENTKPGRYDVEVVVDIDGKRRIKFRPIDVI